MNPRPLVPDLDPLEDRQPRFLEQVAELPLGVLHAPVGVVHQTARWILACNRHAQRI